jgi:hypothetical protein
MDQSCSYGQFRQFLWKWHELSLFMRCTRRAFCSADSHYYRHSYSRPKFTICLILLYWSLFIPGARKYSRSRTTTHSTLRARQPDEFTIDISSYMIRGFARLLNKVLLQFDQLPGTSYMQYSRSETRGFAIQLSIQFCCFRVRRMRLTALDIVQSELIILKCGAEVTNGR